MAQITSKSTLSTLLTTALDKVFTNRGNKVKKIYPRYLKVEKVDKGQVIDYDRALFGGLVKKGEGETLTYDQLEWGNSYQVNMDAFSLGFRITREAADDLKGGGYGVDTGKIAALGEITEAFQDSALFTREDYSAQIVASANSTTATSKWIGAGRDSIALAGTHTLLKNGAGTYSNSMTAAALSYYQLQSGLTLLETIPSDEGFYSVLPNKVILVVGPYNRHRAYELIKSKGKPDTNENNPNALDDFDIEVVVNPYLGSTFKGWALMDPNRHRCYFYDHTPPELDKEGDFETNRGMKFSVYTRFKVAFSSGHGFIHNAGA